MPKRNEFDLIVFGATGFTGALVCAHLARRASVVRDLRWTMAGRSGKKLAALRDAIAVEDVELIVADVADPASIEAMVARTGCVVSLVGPYTEYGSVLVAACAARGVDYLDVAGETLWIRRMIDAHAQTARNSGARILFSCGFDSLPFELGVFACQETARRRLGRTVPRVKAAVEAIKGGFSGGAVATLRKVGETLAADPALVERVGDPFLLTPGFGGAPQPAIDALMVDPDLGPVSPFLMASINIPNVHRSNLLLDHAYGADFTYSEVSLGAPDGPGNLPHPDTLPNGGPAPGEGPSAEERALGYYDLLFAGIAPDGRRVRVKGHGEGDPGYASTSKLVAETALCLLDRPDVPGGIWTPGAALRGQLIEHLAVHAGLTFHELGSD